MAAKNPNPVQMPHRDKAPLQQAYNLDDADPSNVVQDMIRERFTKTIFDSPNDIVGKVLTKPELGGEDSGPQQLSVRGRVRRLHDYLPIVLGPPGEESDAQRLELCKVNLHPVFSTTQPNMFADIGPGSEFVGELQFPEAPFEHYNGTLKAKHIKGVSMHGLNPSDAFRTCRDFLYPPTTSAPTGQAQPGSANPGTTTPSEIGVSEKQRKQKCNTIYRASDFKLASNIDIGSINQQELKDGLNMIREHEGFLPMLLGGYDAGMDSIGYGTLMSGRAAGTQPITTAKILGLASANDLKPVPKSVWSKLFANGANRIVPGNYTRITEDQALEVLVQTKIKPELVTIRKVLNKNIKIADHQVMAMLSLSYQMGATRLRMLCRLMNKGAGTADIYSFFLQFGSGKYQRFRERRTQEAEYFFGNKNYKKKKK